MERVAYLESDTIKLIRSIPQICKNPCQLWSTGKDSTALLNLVRSAFGGRIPWPVIHIDTGMKFDEIYKFRQDMKVQWNIPLHVIENAEAIKLGIGPKTVSKFECCTQLKTNTLKAEIKLRKYDAVILAIRHDEHAVRGMEDLLSLRDENGNWKYWSHFGGFGLTAPEQELYAHIRINPILPWREEDVWYYYMLKKLPVNPLYFSSGTERYRSLGCKPCTSTVKSKAKTIQEIVSEVYLNPGLERSGRLQDKESKDTMLLLRSLGYM
jgi:sulfate adenylyltransferase subunit 2